MGCLDSTGSDPIGIAGLVMSAALPNMLCCMGEGFLRAHWLHQKKAGSPLTDGSAPKMLRPA